MNKAEKSVLQRFASQIPGVVEQSMTVPTPEETKEVEEHVDLATLRLVNESAIRDHALRCSARFRANKFTRVGQDFVDEVTADVESFIRKLRMTNGTSPHDPLEPGDLVFTTGALSDKVTAELNRVIGRIIQQKVQRQPTVGCTLRSTR